MKQPSKPMIIFQFIIAIPVIMAVLFWPAGTLMWIEGWVFLILTMVFSAFMAVYFLKHNPELVKKRMEMKIPSRLWDKIIMLPFIIAMVSLVIVPGFNVRFNWSSVPIYLEILGFIGFFLSLYLTFSVMKVNSYLLKTVEIQKGQKVVTKGPYKYVRHPMYAGTIIMAFSIALALGSLYTLIPAAVSAIFISIRTCLEDKTLEKELKGYKAYQKKVKYRLIPYVF